MSQSVTMPALGESVTEGTITRWLKSEGDSVEVDEPLLEISTDKVDTEVPSPVAGVITKILVAEDDTVEVGAELCIVGDGSEDSGSGDDSGQAEQQDSSSEEAPAEEAPSQDEPAEEPAAAEAEDSAAAPATGQSSGSGEQHAITLPVLGESVTEGTITRWLKSEGDSVEVDEPLLEISTDKVDTEVPSPVAGVISKILVGEDETVEVGAELAYIGDGSGGGSSDSGAAEEAEEPAPAESPDEAPAADEAPAQESAPAAEKAEEKPSEKTAETPAEAASEGSGSRAASSYVTPLVRKLANDKGVDLSTVTGTGVGGRIRRQDVLEAADRAAKEAEQAAAAKQSQQAPASAAPSASPNVPDVSPLRGTTEKMSRLRKIIATRMVESLQVSAQLTTVVEVDVTRVAALRDKVKNDFAKREGTKLTFLPFFVKAATEALKAHPKLNAQIDGDQVIYHGQENVAIAVDTERGLLVPVIKDAGDLNLAGIAKKINDLASRTRDNKVTPDELGGGTFTITNTGSGGALFDTPIINQPQVAILGVGTIQRRPAVVKDADGNETIGIRSLVYLAISYDHRLVDGADAARYLQTVKKRLEEGAFEGELGL